MYQEQPIGCDPISVDPQRPFLLSLFLLLLIFVAAIWLVRLAIFIRQLRFLSVQSKSPSDEPQVWAVWRTCWGHVQWMKQMTILTALLSLLIASWQASEGLRIWVTNKAVGPIALAGGMAEDLRLFALGMLMCSLIFAVYALCEGVLARRAPAWKSHI
jgi:hypothetical protein